MGKQDRSFDDHCAIASPSWCARRLGMSSQAFTRGLPILTEHGFPSEDRILRGRVKADVDAWIESRRQVKISSAGLSPLEQENPHGHLDGL